MELRPFRALRYAPGILESRGLSHLIAPPADELTPEARDRLIASAPENVARLLAPSAGAGETLKSWLADGVLWKERRPGLWHYRQSFEEKSGPVVRDLLVGLVRVENGGAELDAPIPEVPPEARSRRLGFLGETKADFEPSVLVTRAPLVSALASTRRPEFSAADERGVRHDGMRIVDYAQHVELQGLVKNAEAVLAAGAAAWEAARGFAKAPAAAKLSGARYKLCVIVDERLLDGRPEIPVVPAGLFAYSLEDPVY